METLPDSATAQEEQAKRRGCLFGCVAMFLAVVMVVCLILYAVRVFIPSVSEEEVVSTVITTLARESEESFLITGTLTFSTTVESSSDLTLLPGVLDIDLGTTTARVRAPGRVSYGFDVSELGVEDIAYAEDGAVEVELPSLSIFSVEPELEHVEIETDVGWARLYRGSGREREQAALREVRPRMRAAAERHLSSDASGPSQNTARALVEMLSPVLRSAGVGDPLFRFRYPTGEVLEIRSSTLELSELN